MNLEQRVKEALGNLMMQNMALATQLEECQKELAELRSQKDESALKSNGHANQPERGESDVRR